LKNGIWPEKATLSNLIAVEKPLVDIGVARHEASGPSIRLSSRQVVPHVHCENKVR